MAISIEERNKLFKQLRHSLGAPSRGVELEDETLCSLLEISINTYSQFIGNFLIDHQWQSLLGKSISQTDMAFALSVRSMDLTSQYTYAYSKQVGLQTNGPWELKKDVINIEWGRQVYQIPAGREVNEVLWITPPSTQQALLANFGGIDLGFGGGFAQMGSGGPGLGGSGGAGNGGYYIAPAYDILLMAADMNLKNRLIRSDLVYKITAGPNGTKLLHLLSTPGSDFTFGAGLGGGGNGDMGMGSINMTGCQVWYHYYDTVPSNVDQCLADNPDIIKMPNQVPLANLDYSDFNEPTKTTIRDLFFGEAKRTLGRIRGKYGGSVGVSEVERTMDSESLLNEGNEQIKATLERLDALLLRLSSTSQLERAANESQYLNNALKFRPLGIYVW